MADYYHPALRGTQIHEAKVRVLPEGSSFQVPEWEGQMLIVGIKLYIAISRDSTLTWVQPLAYNAPVLPSDIVKFEKGNETPPLPRPGDGIIYQNEYTNDIWYLASGEWLKLGGAITSEGLQIISDKSAESWQGNFFGLLNPPYPNQENCLLIKSWEPDKKYYWAIKTPFALSLGGNDDNNFYIELWQDFSTSIISIVPENSENLISVDTSLFELWATAFRIGAYVMYNGYKSYLNFSFDMEARIIEIKGIANISHGY